MKLRGLSKEIFNSRYAFPGDRDWLDRAKAIAKHIAVAEPETKVKEWEDKFLSILKNGDFMPGGRIIYGSGRSRQNLLNCFCLEPEDNIQSIGKIISDTYKISCGGGGVGFNFSKIRPRGDAIRGVKYSAPGSVSLIKMMDAIGTHVRAGGSRRTALIGILRVDHPDILEFLESKLEKDELNNFNISVGITNRFIEAVENDEEWYFSFNNKKYYIYEVRCDQYTVKITAFDEDDAVERANHFLKRDYEDIFTAAERIEYRAKTLWDTIFRSAVECGDPGIFNIDYTKEWTNVSYFEELNSTNPCGEEPLPNYGNCCLGHLNLDNMVTYDSGVAEVDWKKLARTVRVGVRFLDNVLTVNYFPIPECREVGHSSRRIGMGVTGLHYMLIKLGYRYGDESCCEFLERLFQTIRNEAYKASVTVSKERGPFPMFDPKKYLKQPFAKDLPPRIRTDIKKHGIRNAVLLTAAPTGTISMVLGVSTGIEPIFSPIYKRKYRDSNNQIKEQLVADPFFAKTWKLGNHKAAKDYFIGAFDVTPEEHIKVQATIQRYVDSALSKTCNLPETAKYEDVSQAILEYAVCVKGFTIYKQGSKENEPLQAVSLEDLSEEEISNLVDQCVDFEPDKEDEPQVLSMCSISGGSCE